MISEKNSLYGFINIFSGRDGVLSSCCRLRSDTKAKFFSIGGAGVKIGSSGVTTVNLPHVAFENKSKEDIKEELTKLITKAQDINIARRKIIKKAIDNGSHPLYTLGFVSLGKQYSTVGVNGCHEFLEILGYDIKTKEGIDFFGEVVDHMNSVNDQIGLKHKIPTNIEQVPAESAGRKLAVKDTFMGLNVGENVYKLYSNQFIPLTDGSANLLDRIKVQGILDDKFTGGSILHKNIDQIISQDQMMNLIQSSIKLGCVYFAVNFVLNSCSDCMTTSIGSNVKECPNCGSANLVEATRIVGYLTAKNSWSEQRKEEGSKRVFYKPWAA
jgi:ribonucleoside-triphosphate reductase